MGHMLVLGGARSGKTGFAERLAMALGKFPAYLATAEAWDEEMEQRIARHRSDREDRFHTIEEPLELAEQLRASAPAHDVILVDCVTLWITNLIMAERNVADAVDELIEALDEITTSQIIFVSNEVGLGIVPDNAMARQFRDLAGTAHQRLAKVCETAVFVVAGLPMVLKGTLPPAGNDKRIHEA
jgi:adenosylcobinamide kinase/adenosylcobinamide-phosphate guanylyltransferase